jgi:hypothetical protein
MPAEYLMLLLCRELHCTPSQLKAEDPADVMLVLACLEGEAIVREQENKTNTK